ncbi:homocysteine S-methyltransferase family protein [Tateyamaria sp. ANG-S1]|uniref:homocysteine S-methyltransferase family protein n=1 Tax=Tateyamaria sp. ANG-S1 TaxID=1577905 RepID=UPI00057C72BA|nr:homocysteine S-methyltransferase family protein [Tateyamaria sp. ANG-S1]KIC49949.1 homocysteine methyltransferase [Tateyamaria sp. ANG-S1]
MAEITLLDGGMGQELVHRAGDKPTPLWSTQIMLDHPGMVTAVHKDFFAAGATIATTNSYAIHHDRLTGTPVEGAFSALHQSALYEARTARREHGSGQIAGAIGPLRASYRPDLHPPSEEAVALFAEVAQLLAPACDLLMCETVASLDHARDVLAASVPTDLPIWLAITVDDAEGSKLRSGEPVADVIPIAEDSGASAILINCSTPEAIQPALDALKGTKLPIGAYANGFEQITEGFLDDKPTVDSLTLRRDFTPELYADHVMEWVASGATIVGGCCEVSPAHIAEIAKRLRADGHTII